MVLYLLSIWMCGMLQQYGIFYITFITPTGWGKKDKGLFMGIIDIKGQILSIGGHIWMKLGPHSNFGGHLEICFKILIISEESILMFF